MAKIYSALFKLGTLSGCHQLPERSFFLKGKQFPVCARCTGAFIGQYSGLILYFFLEPPLWLCIIFCAVMFADWFIQRIGVFPSDNIRRLITGILCGYDLISIHMKAVCFAIFLIKDLLVQ